MESEGLVGGGTIWSGTPSCWRSPFILHKEPADGKLMSPPPKPTFSHYSCIGDLPLYGYASLAGPVHPHHPRGTNSGDDWDWGSAMKCKLSTTGPTHSWDFSGLGEQKALCYLSNIFQKCPCWIKGEKLNVEGLGVFGSQCWCSNSRGTDHTSVASRIQPATINSSPSLFILEIASS